MNDIAKDHPELAIETCRRWLADATANRKWIVTHALRSLVKGGHRGALELLGVGSKPRVEVTSVRLSSRRVRLGGVVTFSFELLSRAARTQELLVDYAIHFVKSNGATRPKVFKLRKLTLRARERMTLEGKVSLEDLTTRRHYPGRHAIEVLINGVAYPLARFDVTRA